MFVDYSQAFSNYPQEATLSLSKWVYNEVATSRLFSHNKGMKQATIRVAEWAKQVVAELRYWQFLLYVGIMDG